MHKQTDFKNPSKNFYSMWVAALWTLTIWQQFCWLNYNVYTIVRRLQQCNTYVCICESEFKSFLSCVKPNTITKMTSIDSRWNADAEYTFLYIHNSTVYVLYSWTVTTFASNHMYIIVWSRKQNSHSLSVCST